MVETEGLIERKLLEDRIASGYVVASAHRVWQDQPLTAEKAAFETLIAVDIAYNRNTVFFSGKSKKGIIGGLFYCLGKSLESAKTQKEIARSLGTTEMTIRASSGDWK